jgi:hypothetical protein
MPPGAARAAGGRSARRVVTGVIALVVAAVAVLTFVVRFDRPERQTSGDTYFYSLGALRFAGVPQPVAERDAKRLLCSDVRLGVHLDGTLSPSCSRYDAITAPRYVAIFTSRPLWPLILAPAVAAFGLPRGLIWVSMLGAVLAALAVFLALRGLGSSVFAAGAAGVAFSLLPTGYWSDKLLPEGAVLAVLVAAIFGAGRIVQGHWRGLWVLVPALVALYAIKPANGAALAAGLLVAGVLLIPLRRGRGRALAVTGVGVAGIAGWFAVSSLLHLPSFDDTVQDLATHHFSRPDVPRPLKLLQDMNDQLWLDQLGRSLGVPWPFLIVLPAAVITVLGLRRAGVVWAVVSLAGISIVVAHPMLSQYDRLVSSVWLAVAAAIAVAVDAVARLTGLFPRRSPAAPRQPAPDPVPAG